MKIGCDLVHIGRFQKSVERSGDLLLKKIFCPAELSGNVSFPALAGKFAAKEAAIKALGLKAGDWKCMEIIKGNEGRPQIKLIGKKIIPKGDISISHDGDYAMAFACFID